MSGITCRNCGNETGEAGFWAYCSNCDPEAERDRLRAINAELLEALGRLCDAVPDSVGEWEEKVGDLGAAYRAARAAIAKAEGRQP